MLFAAQQALPMVLWLVVGGIILRKFNYEKDYHLEIREETRYVKFSKHMGKKRSFFILNFYWKALVRLARMMQKAAPGQLLFGEPTNKILPPSLKVKEASDSDGVRMCSEFLVLHLILHDILTSGRFPLDIEWWCPVASNLLCNRKMASSWKWRAKETFGT